MKVLIVVVTVVRVVPDFGSLSGESGIWPLFGNPAKSGSGQIYSQIFQISLMPVQLQYVQLVTDRDVTDSESDGIRHFFEIQNPTDT